MSTIFKTYQIDQTQGEQHYQEELYRIVKETNDDIHPEHPLSTKLDRAQKHAPRAVFLWGQKLIRQGYIEFGMKYIYIAAMQAGKDKNPMQIYVTALRIFKKYDQPRLYKSIAAKARNLRDKQKIPRLSEQ